MQTQSSQKVYEVTVATDNNQRTINVKASDRKTAEQRALKRTKARVVIKSRLAPEA